MRTYSLILAVAVISVFAISCGGGGETITLQGSGASFPAPLYSTWFRMYNEANPDIRVNYQSVGSGAGVKAFVAEETDFGASDAAMSDEEMAKVGRGALLLPMTAGSIVLAYNLPGADSLKLSREAYAGIFLGEVTRWNDPRIAACNPGISLPDRKVTVVHRSDGSGTTYVFTKHLAEISPAWKNGPGFGKSIEWPTGVGGRKNDGVAALIGQNEGAIGYVEFGFARQGKLKTVALENKSGNYVEPSLESATASLAAVKLPENLRAWLPDPEGRDSYPIVTYTWLLAYQKYDDPKIAEALKKVVKWCLTEGQKKSAELYYIPLPQNVVDAVSRVVETIS